VNTLPSFGGQERRTYASERPSCPLGAFVFFGPSVLRLLKRHQGENASNSVSS
jgi:hypothetical protein